MANLPMPIEGGNTHEHTNTATIDEIVAAIRARVAVPQNDRAFILIEFAHDSTRLTGFNWINNNIDISEARRWLLGDVADDMLAEMRQLAAAE